MKFSSSWPSVGMGVVMGEKSSSVPPVPLSSRRGVLWLSLFLMLPLLRLIVLELSLLVKLGDFGVSGVMAPFACAKELFVGVNELISSPAIKEPSLAAADSVGASPESLFNISCCSMLLPGLLNAGWVSIGGARGGTIVTGIGGLAGRVSS
jgi:hypothetical protein